MLEPPSGIIFYKRSGVIVNESQYSWSSNMRLIDRSFDARLAMIFNVFPAYLLSALSDPDDASHLISPPLSPFLPIQRSSSILIVFIVYIDSESISDIPRLKTEIRPPL